MPEASPGVLSEACTLLDPAAVPPPRRSDLIVRPLGNDGQYVIKDPVTGKYFNVGEQEHFLLSALDGQQSGAQICAAFEERFAESLDVADLQDFLEMARRRGLLGPAETPDQPGAKAPAEGEAHENSPGQRPADGRKQPGRSAERQSIFHLRFRVFDPDRLFNRLEPKIRFFWTKGFLLLSSIGIVAAAFLVWTNREELISRFPDTFSWTSVLLVWVLIVAVTTLHEFAHGLTCKHYGGDVHEVGFLLLYFTPCFYCNVSDAWLFREKWKRLWVGLAGGYFDLCLWAAATFLWRLTIQDSLVNYLAWASLSVCGARSLLNLNPLVKLDGYYVLSDWLEVPNLARRAQQYWMATLRWLLWGAPRPEPMPRAALILPYAIVSWAFIISLLGALFTGLIRFQGSRLGPWGIGISLFLFVMLVRSQFRGLTDGEVRNMFAQRHKRTVFWMMGLGLVPVGLILGHINDRVSGSFQVRPRTRLEIRAPEAGFLQEVTVEEGGQVSPGTVIGRLHVPDLESNVAKKRAEVRECQAGLRRLEAGPRPEEVTEQRLRVSRAQAWRDLAKEDLARARQALEEELNRLDLQIAQFANEADYAKQTLAHAEKLFKQRAMSGQQLLAEKKNCQVAESQWEQARAQKRSREASGTLQAEAELARREKELADVRAALTLLEAGTRPEEIEAERAKLARLQEELKYLEGIQERVVLRSPVAGVITTPRMTEKNAQYFEKGAVVCVVEDISNLEAEITLNEEDEAIVKPGQLIELKARSLPFQTFYARVDRKAPSAVVAQGRVQGTVNVYCRLDDSDASLLSGATGFARVYRGSRSIGAALADRGLRYLRTEFWW